MHTVLYGHTGSNNRGCEAIVRSTAYLLGKENISSDLATYDLDADIKAGIDGIGKFIPYKTYNSKCNLPRIYNGIQKKLFQNEYPYERYIQSDVFDAVAKSGSAVVIGGDTYCYQRGAAVPSYNLLKFCKKHNLKAFLWSCSIGRENMDEEKISFLKMYDMIFPRESLTYENVLEVGIPEDRLFKMPDSAFVLKSKEVALPQNFNNVFAYNPSYTLGAKQNIDMIMENRVFLLKKILEETEMNIALIPHVFTKDTKDAKCALDIAERLNCPDRVFVFNEEYTCEELKFIISKCRFLVAERTHASIAGYSTMVPTFVIGYSVKSLGIAKDLFGTDKGYVCSYKDITKISDLYDEVFGFMGWEDEIRNHLEKTIPEYINGVYDAPKKIASML